jgi:tetratricopeptide (TPR) repeat protein
VVDLDAAFGQQLLHVAVRQPEAQLPADREHDHIGREAEASEGRPCESGGAGTASSHGGSLPAPDSITAAATVLGDPSAYLPYRARALTNLGIQLARVGERRGALHTTGEAAGIYAQLAEARPAAYLPSLASVLTNYGTALAGVGDTRAALKATRKAVQIRRRLAEVDPATHPPELARALAAFAEVRAAKGLEVDEARAAADEAFTIFQELARQLPAVFIGSVRATDRIVAKLSDSQRPGTKQPSVLSLSPRPTQEAPITPRRGRCIVPDKLWLSSNSRPPHR